MMYIDNQKRMTACELIEFLAKNVAQLGDIPVCIAYKNGTKFTKVNKFKFIVNSTVDGKSEIVLEEVLEK